MLPWVCSVIDYRWHQKVMRTKKGTQCDSRVCHWFSYHIFTSSVIYYWTCAQQHGIYLVYITKKETTTDKGFYFYFKIFQLNSKAGLCVLKRTQKSHLTKCIVYTKWSNLIGCYACRRIVIGPGNLRHCQTCQASLFLWNENLHRKQNWTAKSAKILEKPNQFYHQSSPVSR